MLQLLLTMAVLFVASRIGSIVVSRFGLPGLIGEIVMGIVIASGVLICGLCTVVMVNRLAGYNRDQLYAY